LKKLLYKILGDESSENKKGNDIGVETRKKSP
jgi:hypothetical protein